MTVQAKSKALVAEDDRALADIIRMALDRTGLDVTVAHDGQRALALARTHVFDLIVTDYQMPRMDGEQLLREIRNGTPSSQAQVILCSAKSYEVDSEQLRKDLKLTTVLYKPFSLSELSLFVRNLQLGPCSKSTTTSNAFESPGVMPVGNTLS